MTWYISVEHDPEEYLLTNAGGKARADVTAILESVGCEPLSVAIVRGRQGMGRRDKIAAHRKAYKNWSEVTSRLSEGDVLVVQFPLVGHTVFLSSVMNSLRRTGARLVLLIHDLDGLRYASGELSFGSKLRLSLEERTALRGADVVIAHNDKMADAIAEHYEVERRRIVSLGIFDYLASGNVPDRCGSAAEPVCIAGNLSPKKSAYLEKLPADVSFALYGGGYASSGMPNVVWHGVVPADELPSRLEGGFGLVWDGNSPDTCSGTTGRYLRFNNPHKASLYLAAGLPVIIWNQAALATFVSNHGCGITISSLEELRPRLDALGPRGYAQMTEAAAVVGSELRSGVYTRRAIAMAADILQ